MVTGCTVTLLLVFYFIDNSVKSLEHFNTKK